MFDMDSFPTPDEADSWLSETDLRVLEELATHVRTRRHGIYSLSMTDGQADINRIAVVLRQKGWELHRREDEDDCVEGYAYRVEPI